MKWIVDENQDTFETVVRNEEGLIVANLEADYHESWDSPHRKENIRKHAELIAAAPDLYAALIQLYSAVKDIPEVSHFLDGNLLQAKEALSKINQP